MAAQSPKQGIHRRKRCGGGLSHHGILGTELRLTACALPGADSYRLRAWVRQQADALPAHVGLTEETLRALPDGCVRIAVGACSLRLRISGSRDGSAQYLCLMGSSLSESFPHCTLLTPPSEERLIHHQEPLLPGR